MGKFGAVLVSVVALALVPWVGADAHRGHHGGGDDGRGDKLLFFASDGLVQDRG